MSLFDDLDEATFVTMEPAGKAGQRSADLRLTFSKMRTAERLVFTFRPETLSEIGGPRYDVGWHPAKRLLLVKPGDSGRFEAHATLNSKSLRITIPLPAGLVFVEGGACEPEFYVDAVGKRLLVELPDDFGRRLALPAPLSRPAPATEASAHSDIEAGNRDILKALGVTRQFPREIRGQVFTQPQACILEALLKASESLTLEALLAATHDPAKGDDDRDAKIVDVWISRMRPQLKALGIEIRSIWGGRRLMNAGGKGALRAALAEMSA